MVLNIVKIYPAERQSTLLMPRILVRVIQIHAYRIRTSVHCVYKLNHADYGSELEIYISCSDFAVKSIFHFWHF